MSKSLKKKAQKSVKWTVINTAFNSIIQPIYRILLAVLLVPSEFAYIAVITLIISFAEMLNNVGVGEAVIQRDNVTRKDLSSLFFFNLIITIIIIGALYSASELIASYYSMSYLEQIIKLLLIVVLINGSTSLFRFYLHKEFYFKETTIIQIIKITVEIFIAVTLIISGYGIIGYLVGVLFSTVIHGALLTFSVLTKTDFRISFFISFKNLSSFLNFGIFIGGKKILTFFSHRVDEVIIGGVLSAEVLGSYFLAKNILLQLQTLITTSFGQVLLPLFSKLKSNLTALKRYYVTIISAVSIISFPIFIGVILTAEYFVPLIFGQEWSLSIEVFQLLAIPVIVEVLSAGITSSLLYSQNKTFLAFNIDLVFAIGYVTLIAFLNNGQLINIIFLYGFYMIFRFIVSQYFVGKILSLTFKDYVDIFKESFISTGIMTVVLLLIKPFIINFSELVILVILIIIGALVYISSNFILNKEKTLNLISLLKGIVKR